MKRNDQEFMIQEIRSKYIAKENSKLDELKALDAKVRRPADVFAYILGSIGAIVMGSGMSLVMTDIGATLGVENTMVFGVGIGVIGLVMAIINYPIFKRNLSSRRRKYADKILALSDEIMKG